jgi:hypothetical protein
MRSVDLGAYIVAYNFVVGVLVMLSSEKVAAYAGNVSRTHRQTITKLTHTSVFTFGATVAVLSGFVYVAFHMLRIGL